MTGAEPEILLLICLLDSLMVCNSLVEYYSWMSSLVLGAC